MVLSGRDATRKCPPPDLPPPPPLYPVCASQWIFSPLLRGKSGHLKGIRPSAAFPALNTACKVRDDPDATDNWQLVSAWDVCVLGWGKEGGEPVCPTPLLCPCPSIFFVCDVT